MSAGEVPSGGPSATKLPSGGPSATKLPSGGKLEGRVAIVTGGGQGIGEAIVRRLASEGARVAVWDLNEAVGKAVAESVQGRFYRVDVTDAAAVEATTKLVREDLGGLHILVNNAGITRDNWITRMPVRFIMW